MGPGEAEESVVVPCSGVAEVVVMGVMVGWLGFAVEGPGCAAEGPGCMAEGPGCMAEGLGRTAEGPSWAVGGMGELGTKDPGKLGIGYVKPPSCVSGASSGSGVVVVSRTGEIARWSGEGGGFTAIALFPGPAGGSYCILKLVGNVRRPHRVDTLWASAKVGFTVISELWAESV